MNRLRRLKWSFVDFLGRTSLAKRQFERSVRHLALYYHVVADESLPHIHGLFESTMTAEQFRSEVCTLIECYRPISLSECVCELRENRQHRKPKLLFTFDDGYKEIYSIVFPVMKSLGVPFSVFINNCTLDNRNLHFSSKASILIDHGRRCIQFPVQLRKASFFAATRDDFSQKLAAIGYSESGRLDRIAQELGLDWKKFLEDERPYLTHTEVTEMVSSGLVEVGAHSIDHPLFQEISSEEQVRQISESMRFVTEHFDCSTKAFAFPFHDRGVGSEVFEHFLRRGEVDVFLGTGDLRRDVTPFSIQRCWMDLPAESAREKVRGIIQRYFWRTNRGMNETERCGIRGRSGTVGR